jgi:RimJ/RimL family protein N-acetyltransferase
MYRLKKEDYSLVRSMFKESEEDYLAIHSIFEGFIDGDIYVDNLETPRVALLLNPNVRNFHLVGDNKVRTIIKRLRDFLETEVYPKYPEKQGKNILVHSEDHWFEDLSQIFGELEQIEKCIYEVRDLDDFGYDVLLPDDYEFAQIDENLFERKDLGNYEIIPRWIKGTWSNQDHYFSRGFGFSTIFKNEEIACVVFSCYANKSMNECELGVITYEQHRQKGLAKKTIAVTLNHCKEIGMKSVNWHCRNTNVPSKKTAETVGFKLRKNCYEFQGIWK